MLGWRGLITYYVLFFIHRESRRVSVAGFTRHPTEEWMKQKARNATDVTCGCLLPCFFLLHDRDSKFCSSFGAIIKAAYEFVEKPSKQDTSRMI